MLRIQILLLLVFSTFSTKLIAQVDSKIISSLKQLKIENGILVFDSTVKKQDYWYNILHKDKKFLTFFSGKSVDSVFICINKIEQFDSLTYEFEILSRPLHLTSFVSNGFCNYKIKFIPNIVLKREEISQIELIGCKI